MNYFLLNRKFSDSDSERQSIELRTGLQQQASEQIQGYEGQDCREIKSPQRRNHPPEHVQVRI